MEQDKEQDMVSPIPNRTTLSVANRTTSDEWRCDYYYFPGQPDPDSNADEEGRCQRLASRFDPATGRHWCDIEWHDA